MGPYSHEKYHMSSFDKFRRFGPVVREEVLWNVRLIHLFDRRDIEQVLHYKSKYPLRPHNEADVFYRKSRSKLYANVGMVNENGLAWHDLRKKLTPPLTNRKTPHHYAMHMNYIADDLVTMMISKESNSGILEGFPSMVYRAGLEMMCNVALARRMGFLSLNGDMTQDMKLIMTALRGYQAASTQAMFGLPWWKYVPASLSGVLTQLVQHKDTLFNKIGELVDDSIACKSTNDGIPNMSILGQLLSNESLALQEIKASCVDYITAGVDTVGNSLIFAIWLISGDARVQQKLQQELDTTAVDEEGLTPEVIQNLTYLKACIKESFRMYPTASQIARLTEEPMEVTGGYLLPKMSVVLCHNYVACRQEENFTRAEEFIPERWLASDRHQSWNHESGLVMPFGFGKRICPGKRLAEQEIHIMAAKIFSKFQMTPLDPLEAEFNFLLSPAGPLRFKMQPRTTIVI